MTIGLWPCTRSGHKMLFNHPSKTQVLSHPCQRAMLYRVGVSIVNVSPDGKTNCRCSRAVPSLATRYCLELSVCIHEPVATPVAGLGRIRHSIVVAPARRMTSIVTTLQDTAVTLDYSIVGVRKELIRDQVAIID